MGQLGAVREKAARWVETFRGRVIARPAVRLAFEVVALTSVAALVDWRFPHIGEGAFRFSGYWIPVILLTAQYGSRGGLLATVAATAANFAQHWPSRLAAQDFYDYAGALALQPCAWLIYALVLGGLRDLQRSRADATAAELATTREGAGTIGEGLEAALAEIAKLERRMASDRATLDAFIAALSEIATRGDDDFLQSFMELVQAATGADHIMLFLRAGDGFQLAAKVLDERGQTSAPPTPPAALIADLATGRKALLWETPGAGSTASRSVCVAPVSDDSSPDLSGLLVVSLASSGGANRETMRRAERLGRLLSFWLRLLARGAPEGRVTAAMGG
jgi:hypothetical protein